MPKAAWEFLNDLPRKAILKYFTTTIKDKAQASSIIVSHWRAYDITFEATVKFPTILRHELLRASCKAVSNRDVGKDKNQLEYVVIIPQTSASPISALSGALGVTYTASGTLAYRFAKANAAAARLALRPDDDRVNSSTAKIVGLFKYLVTGFPIGVTAAKIAEVLATVSGGWAGWAVAPRRAFTKHSLPVWEVFADSIPPASTIPTNLGVIRIETIIQLRQSEKRPRAKSGAPTPVASVPASSSPASATRSGSLPPKKPPAIPKGPAPVNLAALPTPARKVTYQQAVLSGAPASASAPTPPTPVQNPAITSIVTQLAERVSRTETAISAIQESQSSLKLEFTSANQSMMQFLQSMQNDSRNTFQGMNASLTELLQDKRRKSPVPADRS